MCNKIDNNMCFLVFRTVRPSLPMGKFSVSIIYLTIIILRNRADKAVGQVG